VCVVTGASGGIGLETARGLLARGGKLVMVVRSKERGEAAAQDLAASTGNGDIETVLADLYTLSEVRRAGAELRERFPRIHVLVHNAGLIHKARGLTADGFERTFALNHLAPFLLTYELREVLRASAPARVVTVASLAHTMGKLVFDDLHMERRYKQFRAYGTSKLCNVLFARELARRLAGTGVTSNALHPGTVASNFGSTGSWLFRIGPRLVRPFLLSTVKGARTSIHCAASPDVEGVTGEYFDRCKVARTSRAARDPELAKKLWEVSEALCGVKWS